MSHSLDNFIDFRNKQNNFNFVASPSSPNISGGSSPSREVQEILSVKEDSDNILNDEFYDDSNDLLDENDADSVEKVDDAEPYYNQMNGESILRRNTNFS